MNSYIKTNWVNGSAPALSADNLNKIEDGIADVTEAVIALETNVSSDEISLEAVETEIHNARGSFQNLRQRLENTATPTDEQVAEAVSDYLDEHPAVESTTHKKNEINNQSQTGDSDTNYPTVGAVRDFVNYGLDDLQDYVDEELESVETTSNKTTSISSDSTNTQYPSAKAVYEEVLNHTLMLTEVRASYAGASGETPRYIPGKWYFETGADPVEGNIYIIKIPGTNTTSGAYISVHGTADANYCPIVLNGSSRLTTIFGAGTIITVAYETNKTATVYELNSSTTNNTTYSYTGGVFRVLNYYDSGNTNTLLRTYASSSNKEYPLIGASINTSPSPATHTSSYKDLYGAIPSVAEKKATINLSTGKITAPGGFTGNLTGTADAAPWSGVTGKPTTISGYGITDAYTKSEIDAMIGNIETLLSQI